MLIDRIYRKVRSHLNTEQIGTLAADKFNEFLHHAIQYRQEELFYDYSRVITRQNRGMQSNNLQNVAERIAEKMQHYLKTDALAHVTDSTRTIPSDLRYIDSITYSDGTELDMCKNQKEFNILKVQANVQFPIGLKVGGIIKISPDRTSAQDMEITYIREPLIPNWTFQDLGGGQFAFDASAGDFQDADIHPSEEDEMVRRVLLSAGVNLKEKDVQAFAMTEEQNEFRKDNTN